MEKFIKSHVQLAKGHMKPFSFIENKVKKVYCLDLKNRCITSKNIKNVNVIKGYFSSEIEFKLNSEIESKFFSFRNEMIKMTQGVKSISFDEIKHMVVLNYLDVLFLRSNFVLNEYNKNSLLSPILGDISHNFLLQYRFDDSGYVSIFKDYRVISVYNKTKINFVLPAFGFYELKYQFKDINNLWGIHFILPITPIIAFLFIDKRDYKKYLEDHSGSININLENEEDIYLMNKLAFEFEKAINKKFLVSKTKEELEMLLK